MDERIRQMLMAAGAPALRTWPSRIATILMAFLVLLLPGSASPLECEPETIIGGVDQYDDGAAALDIGPDGRVWLVWMNHDPVNYDQEISYSINDGYGWSPQDTLHGHNDSSDRFPVISVGQDGIPWVVWYRSQSNGQRLWYSFWDDGHWSTPEILCTDAERYDDYDVCAVSDDDVWVVSDRHVDYNDGRVLLVWHWDGILWSEPWSVFVPGRHNWFPDFTLGPDDRPWLSWAAYDDESNQNWIMTSAWADTGWTVPEVVNEGPNNAHTSQIVFDGATPMVLWTGNIAASVEVEYSRREGGAWTPPGIVNTPDNIDDPFWYDSIEECVSNEAGDIVALLYEYDYTSVWVPTVFASRWTGAGWAPEVRLTNDAPRKIDSQPEGALAPDGTLWVAWECYEEIEAPWDTDIRGTTCSVTTPVDFALANATPMDGAVRIAWYGGGDAECGPFFVVRASIDSTCNVPSEPMEGAVTINDVPITCSPHECVDREPPEGVLAYWVRWVSATGSRFLGPIIVCAPEPDAPVTPRLLSALPNPSRGGASFAYEVGRGARVSIAIYNVAGRLVTTLRAPASSTARHGDGGVLTWDGTDGEGRRVASGVYSAVLRVNGGAAVPGQVHKLTIVR